MLTDREKLMEFLVALVCGNVARGMLAPEVPELKPEDIMQLANEFRKTNQLDVSTDDFIELMADLDAMMERISETLIHLMKHGNLFKENFKN